MTPEEALTLLNSRLEQKLKDVQELVFRHAWEGWTYAEIAKHAGYDTSYIRDVGCELWQQLSRSLDERVTKKNVQSVLRRRQQTAIIPAASLPKPEPIAYQYWGESIDVSTFYGRTSELTALSRWIGQENCRLVALLGMGGIGKTSLAAKLSTQLQGRFNFIIWQCFRNAPPLDEVVSRLIQILSPQHQINSEHSISQLIECLRESRCLLIFDNVDAILRDGSASDTVEQFRSSYEKYGELFRRIGTERHASCLLLTSREKLRLLTSIEGDQLPVRSLALSGLNAREVRSIFTTSSAFTEPDWHQLTDRYAGNPLALKIVSATVRDLFDGNLSEFLAQGAIAFGDINTLLDAQFQRLSPLEKQVMYWLAIDREWVSIPELRSNIISRSQAELIEALLALRRRSLVEKAAGLFTLQPVVLEYVTEQFIDRICQEIEALEPALFLSHALIKAQSKDYVRNSQVRLILAPIADRLTNTRSTEAKEKIDRLLHKLQTEYATASGYGGGNLISLLQQLNVNLSGYDFSNLSIWQAHLQGTELHNVNFTNSDFANCTFTQTFGSILAVALSSDGILASGGVNEEVCLWRIADGQQLCVCRGHENWVLSVAFSPQGDRLASAGEDGTIRLWEVSTGACDKILSAHADYVNSVTFSPDGRLLASASHDRTIKLWDTETGECLQTFSGHTGWVEQVVFSSDGRMLASGSGDRTIKLWDTETGCLATFAGHEGQVSTIAFSPDDRLIASGSSDRTIRLWNVATQDCINTLHGHRGEVWSIAWLTTAPGAEMQIASGSHDQTIKLWEATGRCLKTLQGHHSHVRSIAVTGSMLASGSEDETIKLFDTQTGQCLKTLQGYSNQIWSIAFHPDGEMLACGSYDRVIRLWNIRTGTCDKILRGHSGWIRSIAFSPNGEMLASGSGDQTVKLWNPQTGECLDTLRGHRHLIRSVAFSPNGKILASSAHDQTIRLWDLNSREVAHVLTTDTVWTRGIAFSPDGMHLAGGSTQNQIALWDVNTGDRVKTFDGHTAQIWSAAFSLDGQMLATGSSDQTVKLWDVRTCKCLQTLEGHSGTVWSVAFSADGAILASGSDDKTVRLWDLQTGKSRILSGHDRSVQSIAFSPQGTLLASGSEDETMRFWNWHGDCLRTLRIDRPYQKMNITGATGLSEVQKEMLCVLGALNE